MNRPRAAAFVHQFGGWRGARSVHASHWSRVAPQHAAADHWLGLGADLISFGRAFISNPDLVERLRAGLPLAAFDEETRFGGGDRGYVDYPAYAHIA